MFGCAVVSSDNGNYGSHARRRLSEWFSSRGCFSVCRTPQRAPHCNSFRSFLFAMLSLHSPPPPPPLSPPPAYESVIATPFPFRDARESQQYRPRPVSVTDARSSSSTSASASTSPLAFAPRSLPSEDADVPFLAGQGRGQSLLPPAPEVMSIPSAEDVLLAQVGRVNARTYQREDLTSARTARAARIPASRIDIQPLQVRRPS
jgi:hypothetical protein